MKKSKEEFLMEMLHIVTMESIDRKLTYIVVEACILTATAFHRDTSRPAPEKTFVTETSLRATLLTGSINAAGTGVAAVGTTQLIMAVGGFTVRSFYERGNK